MQANVYLQLHHGVLTQLVSTCGRHIVNPNQLGLVPDAIASEALNQDLLAAILTYTNTIDRWSETVIHLS